MDQLALMDCWSLILHSGEKNGSSFGLFSLSEKIFKNSLCSF
jgi:hypothetical protein